VQPQPLNVLVVYATLSHPLRTSVKDHLRAFERAGHRCFYLNLMVRRVPRWVHEAEFDLIVFHTTFLAQRWVPRHFEKVRRRATALRDVGGTRVAMPQDEFLRTDDVVAFAEEAGVDVIASVAPPAAWPVAYPRLDRRRVELRQVLTGYLEPNTVARTGALVVRAGPRRLDIGYRAWAAAPWLGRHGMLKTRIADAAAAAAARRGLRADISTAERDQLVGDDWLEFLAACETTIGVEGGASVCDRDGSVKAATETYLARRPDASFEEIERACFPGRDGELPLAVLSPRHLEACATRTCQVLVEGEYNGVLHPGIHYVALRRDLSNLNDALDEAADPTRRAQITAAAHRDVVESGVVSYRRMVDEVVNAALGDAATGRPATASVERVHRRARDFDRLSRSHVVVKGAALRTAVRTAGPLVRRGRGLLANRNVHGA
jgi:hypothetical protein